MLEVDVDDRRDEQRQKLREQKSADHRETERLPRVSAGAERERDRQAAHQRGHRGHHDRPEPRQTGLADRFFGRPAFLALRVKGEVDHHDGVLLHDPDQHDDADERVEIQIGVEEP